MAGEAFVCIHPWEVFANDGCILRLGKLVGTSDGSELEVGSLLSDGENEGKADGTTLKVGTIDRLGKSDGISDGATETDGSLLRDGSLLGAKEGTTLKVGDWVLSTHCPEWQTPQGRELQGVPSGRSTGSRHVPSGLQLLIT